MPPWWGKSSSKEPKKKSNEESFIDKINRKLKIVSDEKGCCTPLEPREHYLDTVSEKEVVSRAHSRSPSPSTLVSRSQSLAERPLDQPLPLPGRHLPGSRRSNSVTAAPTEPSSKSGPKPLMFLPIREPGSGPNKAHFTDIEDDLAISSAITYGSSDSDDPSDSHPVSPQAYDYENGTRSAMNSPTYLMPKVQSPKNANMTIKPDLFFFSDQVLRTSPKRRPGGHIRNIQIPHNHAFGSAPDSSVSSPCRSPMRVYEPEQAMSSGFWAGKPYSEIAFLESGQCSSPGSGHNSVAGDISGQPFWQQNRCSPECSPLPSPRISPIPSPRMMSPGPSSRIPSGAVTPIESPKSRPDNGKQQSHRLPLPPLTISNTCPLSPNYSTVTSPSVPRSPTRAENPTSPGARWQKGRLLGRGTFGHVYLGFNRESGEMCAMKEVTLFADDSKSKENAQHLGQEIALLSRLQHPNIVQYYGSETVDDKLYIYLEFVSGGSIYKLLQEYGQFGELAIRSYTQQILSGLAFLHAKNTVHRDIKGANLLVDPNGRVKLADFGMAKHISGQSCVLSFKGSPYWMAPEVINNSNGCNLAVDIWSLGCTVLEMATTKPPWSQYEGVPALFKIGNSKELPPIPDHLSDDGKDFVRKCLQRNPFHRPTAAQLLEHPFVKNVASLDRPILRSEPSESSTIISAARSLGVGEGVAAYQSRGSKIGSNFSDACTPRNMSCPISPIGSPLQSYKSPQQMSGRRSPSPVASPRIASGSTTPLTSGNGAIPFSHQKQPGAYSHDGPGIGTYLSGNTFHQLNELESFRTSPVSHLFPEVLSAEYDIMGNHPVRSPYGDPKDFHDGKSAMVDHLSRQLHIKSNPSTDFNPVSPIVGHMNRI